MKSLFFILLLAVACGVSVGLIREYFFDSSSLDWNDAQLSCRRYFKDLATITTMDENTRLVQSGNSATGWIGLKRTSGNWAWPDGDQISFLNWYHGSPYHSESTNECGFVYPDSWVNYECSMWATFYCYRFLILVKENKTWEEAQDYCRTNYTGLASVTSESTLKLLKLETVQTQTESVWTGLHFIDREWLWVSGEQLGSLVSMPSCPAPFYRCGALNTTTDTLKNQHCNDRLNFICY